MVGWLIETGWSWLGWVGWLLGVGCRQLELFVVAVWLGRLLDVWSVCVLLALLILAHFPVFWFTTETLQTLHPIPTRCVLAVMTPHHTSQVSELSSYLFEVAMSMSSEDVNPKAEEALNALVQVSFSHFLVLCIAWQPHLMRPRVPAHKTPACCRTCR